MNYLELAVKARQECGASGTGPAAVTNQTGESKRIVDWAADAWTEIQNRHENWKWMRSSFTFNTVLNDDTYAFGGCTDTKTSAAIARFARWWWENLEYSFRIYLQSSGVATEGWLIPMDYEQFKRRYRFGTQNNGFPAHYTIDEDDNILLGPKPNGVYVVSGDYQRGALVLAANSDTPDMPARFHMLIVYEAMLKYAGYESAQEVWTRAMAHRGVLMRQLEGNQLPQMKLAEPLA